MKTAGNHFWVAETENGQVIGMIGVQHDDQGVGEVRRLRVANRSSPRNRQSSARKSHYLLQRE